MVEHGKLAVGRIVYEKNGKYKMPKLEGYKRIVVMMKSHCKKWYPLSPYALKTDDEYLIENYWQFSKVYKSVPKSKQTYSRYDSKVIWNHPAETHIDQNGEITSAYYAWRRKGFENEYPVRYPVGYNHRSKCQYSISEDGTRLDYIAARKEIYLYAYKEAVKKTVEFQQLLNMLKKGVNLLIVEVDGPHEESMSYYMEQYDVPKDWIHDNCVEIKGYDTLEIFLNDPKHPFGHGYVLCWTLLEMI